METRTIGLYVVMVRRAGMAGGQVDLSGLRAKAGAREQFQALPGRAPAIPLTKTPAVDIHQDVQDKSTDGLFTEGETKIRTDRAAQATPLLRRCSDAGRRGDPASRTGADSPQVVEQKQAAAKTGYGDSGCAGMTTPFTDSLYRFPLQIPSTGSLYRFRLRVPSTDP